MTSFIMQNKGWVEDAKNTESANADRNKLHQLIRNKREQRKVDNEGEDREDKKVGLTCFVTIFKSTNKRSYVNDPVF